MAGTQFIAVAYVPIESYPGKEGEWISVFVPHVNIGWRPGYKFDGKWWDECGEIYPTHFVELPAPKGTPC